MSGSVQAKWDVDLRRFLIELITIRDETHKQRRPTTSSPWAGRLSLNLKLGCATVTDVPRLVQEVAEIYEKHQDSQETPGSRRTHQVVLRKPPGPNHCAISGNERLTADSQGGATSLDRLTDE